MALAKDHHQISSRVFYENNIQFPHIFPYNFDDEYDQHQYDGDSLENPNYSNNKVIISPNNQVISTNSPTISNSSSANSSNNGLTINPQTSNNYQTHEEAHSLLHFKSGYGSVLSFQNENNNQFQLDNNNNFEKINRPIDFHYPVWEGCSSISGLNNQQQQQQQQQSRHQLKEMKNGTANSHLRNSISDYNQDLDANEWIYAEANVDDPPQESATQQTCFNKRKPNNMENMQPSKKSTTNTSKKPKFESKLKDPQSVAAKNRRERISERLKILQDLVPNGSKVDLVTMLEKAIGYVKFLQLQLKVLATDEFWPAAGGNAPDISQVKEAIDAILSSQRSSEGTTSSNSK
ncbi:hypothetical protein RND81_10G118100 [Saponaria officinalis]|uniref:BHLH domain-containing protein n=1 Tax=Saponaria officinalis TaxID=3572 RepID=A0AAW1I1Y3_SAPOF